MVEETVGKKVRIDGIFRTKEVFIDGIKLNLEDSLSIINHSPDGFNWNYCGSGPAQLALAILLEVFGKEKALRYYQVFKQGFIARLPASNFTRYLSLEQWKERYEEDNKKEIKK